jgi:ethanolamine utilization protein EutA (predicted chaperonin)
MDEVRKAWEVLEEEEQGAKEEEEEAIVRCDMIALKGERKKGNNKKKQKLQIPKTLGDLGVCEKKQLNCVFSLKTRSHKRPVATVKRLVLGGGATAVRQIGNRQEIENRLS